MESRPHRSLKAKRDIAARAAQVATADDEDAQKELSTVKGRRTDEVSVPGVMSIPPGDDIEAGIKAGALVLAGLGLYLWITAPTE